MIGPSNVCLLLLLGLERGSKWVTGDNLHPTPPMGFSSWNTFLGDYDEANLLETAKAIKRLDLDTFGYIYLTVDDFWQIRERDAQGRMQVNRTRFPHGMRFLSDQIHALGLKFGLYSNAGYRTCGGMAGSLGFEEQDVKMLLDYQVDYFKYDNCYPKDKKHKHNMDYDKSLLHLPSYYQDPPERVRYEPMSRAIRAVRAQRNITVELCAYGWGNVEKWGPNLGQIWRTSGDIWDTWSSVLKTLDRNDEERFVLNQGPTLGWNYPDAMFVGKGGMTMTEYKTMFAMWCVVKSPLMLGADIRTLKTSDPAYHILTHRELLAINQDKLGRQATCILNCCSRGIMGGIDTEKTCPGFRNSFQLWKGPLDHGSIVLVILNRFDRLTNITFAWMADAQLSAEQSYKVRDVWQGRDLETIVVGPTGQYSTSLPAHDSLILRLKPVSTSV